MEEQRKQICQYLQTEITNIAKSLPVQKVVPYANIKKKNYPLSNKNHQAIGGFIKNIGVPERIRTSDLRFRKPTLYPTELREHML